MTAKEKARILIEKFSGGMIDSKKLAIICVDEIMKSDDDEHPSDIKIQFWVDVKSEIEKL